jgi:hypothetical protein
MKRFSDYLMESTVEHSYRIKFACPVTDDMLDRMETHLKKYEAIEISKPKKAIAQSSPMDFKEARGAEITTIDVTTQYPVASYVLARELASHMKVSMSELAVRSPDDELDEQEGKYESKLTDSEYKDAPDTKASDHYGDEYNSKFVKELTKLSAERKKAMENNDG